MISNSGLSSWGRFLYDHSTGVYVINNLSRIFPSVFRKIINFRQKPLRLSALTIIFTFDCDTYEDIDASCWIYEEFSKNNLKFTLSVPGEQLIEGQSQYKYLAQKGVPFINHGFKSHAYKEGGRYFSKTFYREMSVEQIIEDIKKGHQTIIDITGKTPKVFRTPHFGTFCKSQNLDLIHGILNEMGYEFSSSSIPLYGMLAGFKSWTNKKITEIPLSGTHSSPLTVCDSWSYVDDPYHPKAGKNYFLSLTNTILAYANTPQLLCTYADPAHLSGSALYSELLTHINSLNIKTLHFEDLMIMLKKISDD